MTATPITSDRTDRQDKQYKRFVEDAGDHALAEVNPGNEATQRLFGRGPEFHAYLIAGVRRFSAAAPDYGLARTILGKDFISPEEIVESRRAIVYTDEQLAKFSETLPAQDVLEWCRDNGMMLVAGPPQAMSLLDIRDLNPEHFYSKQGGWYAERAQTFSRNDKAETVWIALRKEPVQGSLRRNWAEQEALVTDPMVVPNAAETVWCLTTYKAVRDIYLLPTLYVRTSSVDSDGVHVLVGLFGAEGLRVDGWNDSHRYDHLGVAAARK